MRILVTGSREVKPGDWQYLEAGLFEVIGGKRGPHMIVHGDARGADRLFGEITKRWGWGTEAHAADWDAECRDECSHGPRRSRKRGSGTYCPAAGDYRNQLMVDLGADFAVAAYKRGAKNAGTSDCVRRIRAAGIDVKRVVV